MSRILLLAVCLTTLLCVCHGAPSPSILRFRSPFFPCGFDPSGHGLCLTLDQNIYESLLALDFGSRLEFTSFPVGLNHRVSTSLTRFTATESGEDKPRGAAAWRRV